MIQKNIENILIEIKTVLTKINQSECDSLIGAIQQANKIV
jgi:hypothetical protein